MSELDFETSLNTLSLLTDALTLPTSLDQALNQIVTLTGSLMETEQTAIMLRDEEHSELVVRTLAGIGGPALRAGYPLEVPVRLKNILWRLRSIHQISWVNSGIDQIGFPILVTPLCVKGVRIGLLATGKCRFGSAGFNPVRRRLFELVATFASLVIENAKVYDYLRQQFAQRSQELAEANRRDAAGKDEAEQLMISSISNPNKVVRLLAESFYKELSRAGFGPGHIMTAAAHILECITRADMIH